jgi:hypothetical protein
LRQFAREFCRKTNVSYQEVSVDGWGNPFHLNLENEPELMKFEVRSTGSDGELDGQLGKDSLGDISEVRGFPTSVRR